MHYNYINNGEMQVIPSKAMYFSTVYCKILAREMFSRFGSFINILPPDSIK